MPLKENNELDHAFWSASSCSCGLAFIFIDRTLAWHGESIEDDHNHGGVTFNLPYHTRFLRESRPKHQLIIEKQDKRLACWTRWFSPAQNERNGD